MAELRTCIPNYQFQQMVIEAMMNEETEDYMQLIVSLSLRKLLVKTGL